MEKCICSNHNSIRRGQLGYIRIANGALSKTNPTELHNSAYANTTEVISNNHRPQGECVYFLPAPPPAAFFSSAAFCLASMMAATFSFSLWYSVPDMLFFDFTEAAAFWFFSRALSLWLPRAMLSVTSCHDPKKKIQIIYSIVVRFRDSLMGRRRRSPH